MTSLFGRRKEPTRSSALPGSWSLPLTKLGEAIPLNSDFKDLLSLFEKHQVRYLVAGGYAVMFYSEPRYTKDLDVVVGTAPGEAEKVANAMAEFGFPMTNAQVEAWKKPNQMIVLGRPPSRIDILNELTGIDFEAAWEKRVSETVGEISINFLSLQDLIEAKRAVGRPQDLIDIANLEAVAVRNADQNA